VRPVLLPRSAATLVAALQLVGCGTGGAAAGGPGGTDAAPGGGGLQGEVVVLAAASLTGTLEGLARTFEAEHPGTRVTTSFAGSSALAQQVLAGAPGDVFVSAAPGPMAMVVDAGAAAADPVVLARNVLVLAVPTGNPGDVRGLADLAEEDLVVALCEEQVPCGALSAELLGRDGVVAAPDTLEQDVRGVLSRLRLGEVDAGLVYRTDVAAAGEGVEVVDVPGADQLSTDYQVAPLAASSAPEVADAFVALLLSEQGRAALSGAGFRLP